ncbi:acyl-CoA dehydrogenase family protein [Pseudomonas sp. NPDC086251]|uniref:acyl-CoA dehydrogenase family protein n=1 Tax=Pseudomonas sp. NPDC086251 TaxID=3364431 RepID=UPI003836C0BE
MDFQDTPQEAAYRAQVRAWLRANARAYEVRPEDGMEHERFMALARGWQRAKAEAGYVGIMWPKDVGGQGGSPIEHVIFHQEEEHFSLPVIPFAVGIGMCLPTLFTHGSAEVLDRFMAKGMRGEEIWCQLFSEPAAGSDLAGLRTRAVREGGDWVINGQKVWTSYAHESDYGIVLVRTDPNAPKHKGLTMFYVDMRTPGVEVRPIRTLLGDAEFNEVFFTDVRIPDSQRLGEVGEGWKVSLSTLMFERLAVGGKPSGAPVASELAVLFDADALARFYVADEGITLTRMRSMTAVSRGGVPGPEASINKLVMAKNLQDMSACALEALGADGLREFDDSQARRFNYWYMWSAGLRIAGGTDEILRNIIAERVLGLPPEPRSDRDTPFNKLGKG